MIGTRIGIIIIKKKRKINTSFHKGFSHHIPEMKKIKNY